VLPSGNLSAARMRSSIRSPPIDLSNSQIDKATIFSPSLSSCFSLFLIILFCLELSPFFLGATVIFPIHSYTQKRSIYSCDDTHLVRWTKVKKCRARKMNSVFITGWFDSSWGCQCFLGVDFKRKNIFDLFRKIFNMLCYIPLPLAYNKSTLANANSLQEIII